ncbi:hypothetical protein SERLA73DRAFT_104611 [Serpula lacrymans var. lacrymans S7.3]|uniref:Nop14-like protein n=1 Tax=Serpula lacrymans var. lacrymans (strain S7.3) TaxID=936435 RepID=F8PQH0_SERL3|nr:hypothetical protein SERLA73DRAFT_104611 [Serpula lacrymans var. lacrymans S7.3]
MAKSQLNQLKSALSQAGLSQTSQNGKKRKKSGSEDTEKVKKAARLQAIHQRLNQFDTKVTKLKHDVGGRKIKGAIGHPAQSKQAGIEQRKRTLLKEYQEKGHAGGMIDRRFGENDPTMSVEDRMLERFTRERQRSSKASAFNLQDEEELTHYGRSLSMLDDFDNVGLHVDDEDEDDERQIGGEVVKHTHFGGFDDEDEDDEKEGDESERKKSKAEVMAEVMAKSKEHKLRRQMEKEQGENIRHQLDQDFDTLKSLLYAPDPSSTGSNSIPLGVSRKPLPQDNATTEERPIEVDYDQQVRELAFEKRAKAKDRTKTEEEIALEEKEALEKAERQRKRRMLGEEEDGSDEDEAQGRKKRKRDRGGDDLDDDFHEAEEDWAGLGSGLGEGGTRIGNDEVSVHSDSEDDSEDNGEGKEGEGEEEAEESDNEEVDDDEMSEGEEGELTELTTRRKSRTSEPSTFSKELPYTFACPGTHEEFLEIVEDVEDEDVPTVIQRIRTLYHTSLAADNKFKLQTLATVLVDHVLYIASPPTPRFTLLSSLLPHLFALCKSYPIESAEYFVGKLSLMHKNLKRGLSQGALDPEARTWPGVAELSLFRVIGATWPVSDLKHPVISPARLLMGAYLGLCRVRSLADIASGLFLCTLFLQYEELSQRLVPEAVNFAMNAVLHLAPHSYKDAASLPGSFPSPDLRSELCLPLSIVAKKTRKLAIQKPNLAQLLTAAATDEQTKIDLLGLSFDALDRFANMYKGLEGFIELFEPIQTIFSKLDFKSASPDLETKRNGVQEKLSSLLKFARRGRSPLKLQAHKPIPIPTYIPKFETSSSSYMRHRDPDHERNEMAKLRYQHKQEKKGAIRELRKDAKFLASVEQEKTREKDRAYKQSMNKVFNSLEGERAEQKAMEREKAKEKKRSGRK